LTDRSRFSVFADRSDVHRDLHSFPTRRSSDLTDNASISFQMQEPPLSAAPVQPGEVVDQGESASAHDSTSNALDDEVREVSSSRSEEHTSELQSRENLVCRLLLEKKKLMHTLY